MTAQLGPILDVLGKSAAAKLFGGKASKLGAFIKNASLAGFAQDQIISFLQGISHGEGIQKIKERIEPRSAAGTALPSEEDVLRQRSGGIKGALSAAAPVAAGLMGARGAGGPEPQGQMGQDIPPGAPPVNQEAAPKKKGLVEDLVQRFQKQYGEGESHFDKAVKQAEAMGRMIQESPKVSKIKERLDDLYGKGVPYEDASVQKFVRALLSGTLGQKSKGEPEGEKEILSTLDDLIRRLGA